MKETIPWPEQTDTGYIRLQRKEFKNYITDELSSLIEMWHRIKAYGWPQGKGYLAEPSAVVAVVRLFDTESQTFRGWENRKNGANKR